MAIDFPGALEKTLEVVMFENWLRFYFIAEEGDAVFLRLPDRAMERINADYCHLAGLASRLNNQAIDHQTSLNAVCLFVANELLNGQQSDEQMGKIFDSPAFHLEMQLFSSWVQSHEEQLDRTFLEFSDWQKLFAAWKETDEAGRFADSLMDAMHRTAQQTSETTQ